MKKLILTLLLVVGLVVPAQAATFYRVILDLPFENLTQAIALMNLIETHKDKIYTVQTLEGNTAQAKMVGSWDTEFVNQPEYTMIQVDFTDVQQVYDAATFAITQADIDAKQALVNAKQAKLNELQLAIDAAQAELNAQP